MIKNVKKDGTAWTKADIIVVDECDVLVLDQAKAFSKMWEVVKKLVSGAIFLTATTFDKT